MRRLHSSHSYRFVLVLIMAMFVFIMGAPNTAWARGVTLLLLCATLGMAVWTSGLGWNLPRTLGLSMVGVGVVAAAQFFTGHDSAGALWLLGFLFALSTIAVIALGVVDQGDVNGQSIVGAICIYLLLGMLFSFAYGAAAGFESSPFFAQGTDGTPSIRLYFSYITMATVGYGDYSVAGDLGRTLAVLEGLLGQLYLVTVVAMLVSRVRIRQPEDSG